MHKDFVTDALEQAWDDCKPSGDDGLIHHSGRGSQYLSIRYRERLAEAGIEPSVGSKGDSYDNAMTETVNGLYKTGPGERMAARRRLHKRLSVPGPSLSEGADSWWYGGAGWLAGDELPQGKGQAIRRSRHRA